MHSAITQTFSSRHAAPTEAKASTSVELALVKSQQVQEKIEACAVDLSSANVSEKSGMTLGATLVAAEAVLAHTEQVEGKVVECVEDLHHVNDTLTQGMDELKRTELALAESRANLAASQLALAHALEAIRHVRDLALHDSLTGLPNRELFLDRLGYAIALAQRREWNLAVIFLDLDGFKPINDALGHAAGDEVLRQTAQRLTQKLRFADTVCRYGGDEFVLLLMNPQASHHVRRIAEELLAELAAPMNIGDSQVSIRASLGIALYPDHDVQGSGLIDKADAAMYVAKKSRSRLAFAPPR